jgi:parvulin-like peptidyl-prolyl isomerase
VLRSTLFALEQGELSRPMLIDDRYVLIQHVRDVPGDDVTYFEVRDAMRQEVRQQQERALMDQYARELLREASITIFDESLNESWRMNRRGRR